MEKRGFEIKVGFFVLLAVAAAGFMIVRFSKGGSSSKDNFTAVARFAEIGGLIRGAAIQYQGVYVGHVSDISLDESTHKVLVRMTLGNGTRIPNNSLVEIRQNGFLGDKLVAITPVQPSSSQMLAQDSVIEGSLPTDISNLSSKAAALVDQISGFLQNLDTLAKRLNTELLDQPTIANAKNTIANVASVSSESIAAMREIRELLKANRIALDTAIVNFASLSANMERTTKSVNTLVADNTAKITNTVTNVEAASADFRETSKKLKDASDQIQKILSKLESDESVVALLTHDKEAKENLQKMLNELSAFATNINENGILGYKKNLRPKPTTPAPPASERPKQNFNSR